MRAPTLQEEVDALRDRYFKDERERKFVEGERTEARLRLEGWTEKAIHERKYPADDEKHKLCGVIEALQETQHPWGAPEHMSDRKSKRHRTTQPPFTPWYQRGVLDDCGIHPVISGGGAEVGILGTGEPDDT